MRFAMKVDYVDEVEREVEPLDPCEVISGIPYLRGKDATFYKKEKKYCLGKGGNGYLIKTH